MRFDRQQRRRVRNLDVRISKILVLLVAGQMEQQEAREQAPCGGLCLALGSTEAQGAEESAAFDQSGVLGVIHGTCDDRTAPLHAQRPGIAGQRIDVVFAGEDQSGRCDLRRVVLRLGCCRGREQCGYRTDIPALRCGQYRSARAHAVTGKGDPIGLDADLSGAESHADADVERRSKICSQSEM